MVHNQRKADGSMPVNQRLIRADTMQAQPNKIHPPATRICKTIQNKLYPKKRTIKKQSQKNFINFNLLTIYFFELYFFTKLQNKGIFMKKNTIIDFTKDEFPKNILESEIKPINTAKLDKTNVLPNQTKQRIINFTEESKVPELDDPDLFVMIDESNHEQLTFIKMAELFGLNYNQEVSYGIFVKNECIWNYAQNHKIHTSKEQDIYYNTLAALQMKTDIRSLRNFDSYRLLGFAVKKTSTIHVATLIVRNTNTGKILPLQWIDIKGNDALKSFMYNASNKNPKFLTELINKTLSKGK